MPGHVKTGGPKEADPDPSEFLIVSFEMKKEDSLKPYDAKKSVWVPDGEGGFDEAMIDSVDGDKVNVKRGEGGRGNDFVVSIETQSRVNAQSLNEIRET